MTRAAAPLLALLVLAGCATTTRAPDADWITGRLALTVASTPPRQLTTAFELRGDAGQGELRLLSPLGTVVAGAVWSAGAATLRGPDGEETRYADIQALSRDALGESLPLDALPSWLRGQPWPGADSRATDGGFEQLGWQIGLQRWAADGALDVSRSAPPPAVMLRARVDRVP